MTANGILQITLFTAVVLALAKPMGIFMAKVFAGERTLAAPRAAARSKRRSTDCAASTKRPSSTGRDMPARCWHSAW